MISWHRNNGEDLEAAGYLAEPERRVEDSVESRGQLVGTVFGGGLGV